MYKISLIIILNDNQSFITGMRNLSKNRIIDNGKNNIKYRGNDNPQIILN